METSRPLVCLDTETTGTDVAKDRIVSLEMRKEQAGVVTWWESLFNPGVKIPETASSVHGITDAMVASAPTLKDKAQEVVQFLAGCDLVGYNLINYDVPLLWEELARCGIVWDLTGVRIIDVSNIFRKKEERTLSAAVQFYCGRSHEGAHGARADVQATVDVLAKQLERYKDLTYLPVAELATLSAFDNRVDLAGKLVWDKDGDAVYNIGKCKGVKVKNDPGFARWMLDKDFTMQTKAVVKKILAAAKVA